MQSVDRKGLDHACKDLGDVIMDPATWPRVMEDICRAAGAHGAVLLQTDVRTPDVPYTPGCEEMSKRYFQEGWHLRDSRAERGVPLLLAGASVIIDQDLFATQQEMERDQLYGEPLTSLGLKWFAAVDFMSGPAHWGLSIQRTPGQGAFSDGDKLSLATLSRRLSEAATISTIVGRAAIASSLNALALVEMPAIAVQRQGYVLGLNEKAANLFDDEFCLRLNRISVKDRNAQKTLASLFDRLSLLPDSDAFPAEPIVIKRETASSLILKAFPVHPAAKTAFLGARALLTATKIEARPPSSLKVLERAFNLTPAEIRLAAAIADGSGPEHAAEKLKISRETARNQLKAIFAKTGTHRQGQLIALLARL